jgi:C_GCAxxG_C_C family probable redox protein
MNRVEQAVSCYKGGFSCAPAVFSAYAPEFGLDTETALKIATGFGAGMGRMSETCGAVTGAFMAIGLKYGKSKAEDNQAREKTYELVREFASRFKACNGSIVCKELLGCDLGTPEGMKFAKETGVTAKTCPKLVQNAVEILEEMMME